MSNEATRMYSTWRSTESAGYWERMRDVLDLGLKRPGECVEAWDESNESSSSPSRNMGGCGERALKGSLRTETEGEREGGNEDREGWRWRPTGAAEGAVAADEVEGADEAEGCDWEPVGRCAITSAMSVSIVKATRAAVAACCCSGSAVPCARRPHLGVAFQSEECALYPLGSSPGC
jgi:hypothetical protein